MTAVLDRPTADPLDSLEEFVELVDVTSGSPATLAVTAPPLRSPVRFVVDVAGIATCIHQGGAHVGSVYRKHVVPGDVVTLRDTGRALAAPRPCPGASA